MDGQAAGFDVIGGEGDPNEFWAYPLEWGDRLSNHDWMPLYVNSLLTSDFVAHACADGRRGDLGTALILWCESLKQDPAGTLPDDDVALAQLARFGADVDGWRAVRAGALWGWSPVHIDGERQRPRPRLGHRMIAEIARDMFGRKQGRDAAREAQRKANDRHRIKTRLRELGYKKAHWESAQVVGLVQGFLAQNKMYITDDNVRTAMAEAAGIARVVAFPGRAEGGA